MLPGFCAVTERMVRAAAAARTNRLAIVECFDKDSWVSEYLSRCGSQVLAPADALPLYNSSPTSLSPLFTLWTLRLRKPRSWSHVATVQQNTDRDYGAHSRLQIQMLYSTLATAQRSSSMRTGSLYRRIGTVGATRCGS